MFQIILHSPSRSWFTAELPSLADEQLFSSLQGLWPLGLSCLGRTAQAERAGCAGWTRVARSQGSFVLCFILALCSMFSKWILLSVRSKSLAGFTLVCYICKNHPWDFQMSTALMLCLDKNLKYIKMSRWQTRGHSVLTLPSGEVTFCAGSWDVKYKSMWCERVNQPHIVFHLFSVQKWCSFCLHCAVMVMNSLCWTSPWCTVRLCFGLLIHFLGSEQARKKKYAFLLHVVREKKLNRFDMKSLDYWKTK